MFPGKVEEMQCEEMGDRFVSGKACVIPCAKTVVLMLAQQDERQWKSALHLRPFFRVRCARGRGRGLECVVAGTIILWLCFLM